MLFPVRFKKVKQEVLVPNFTYEVQKTAENIYYINVTTIEVMFIYPHRQTIFIYKII